jgi:hypothetical protein
LQRMGISEAGEGLRLKPALPDALAAVVQRLETS